MFTSTIYDIQNIVDQSVFLPMFGHIWQYTGLQVWMIYDLQKGQNLE